jgi:hypothetical protein
MEGSRFYPKPVCTHTFEPAFTNWARSSRRLPQTSPDGLQPTAIHLVSQERNTIS